jgi:hypothetical protein
MERAKAAQFIGLAGMTMKVGRMAQSTAMILMHRFYQLQSLKTHNYYVFLPCFNILGRFRRLSFYRIKIIREFWGFQEDAGCYYGLRAKRSQEHSSSAQAR